MAELKLTELVQRVDQDKLVIPDFQRGFKWQTPDIRKLLESLLLDFPIGAALFWRTQRGMLEFRRIEDVHFSDDDEDESSAESVREEGATDETDFVLDGQQRITSIYKLFPRELAPTDHEMDSRFRGLRFFLALERLGLPRKLEQLDVHDFESFKDPDAVANAIVEKRHPDLKKEYRQVSGEKRIPPRLTDDEILLVCQRRLWLPLTRSFLENKQSHLQRLRRVVEADLKSQLDSYEGPHSRKTLESRIESGLDRWADWFTSNFQATLNSKSLTCLILGNDKPEGLARIFETINSTGLSLSVFDLLVARLGTWDDGGEKTNLRKLILTTLSKELLQKFDDEKSLGGTASQQMPRLLALRANTELKKGDILKTPKRTYLDVVAQGGKGLKKSLSILNERMGVLDDSYLPFKDIVCLLGAVCSSDDSLLSENVAAFGWTVCFIEDWDSNTNDKTRGVYRLFQDFKSAKVTKDDLIRRLETSFPVFEDVRDATSKASIAYRALMSFNLARRGIDWAKNERALEEVFEDHHLFPKDWLSNNREATEDKQTWISLRDSVLNRIFVTKQANQEAKAQTPPNYLAKLSEQERRCLQIPDSFLGPLATPIQSEAFSKFLKDRYDLMRSDYIAYVRKFL